MTQLLLLYPFNARACDEEKPRVSATAKLFG